MFRPFKFVIVLVLGMMVVVGIAPGGAAAQDGGVRRIPVTGEAFVTKLSPDGRLAAIAESGLIHSEEVIPDFLPIQLIDMENGAVTRLTGQTDYATDIAWSPDGRTLVSYHGGGTLSVWDVVTGTEQQRIPAIPGRVRLTYLPDGHTLALQGITSQPLIFWWDLDVNSITGVYTLRYPTFTGYLNAISGGPPEGISAFVTIPNGSGMVVSTLYDNVWRWDTGQDQPDVLVQSGDDLPMLDIRFMTVTADSQQVIYLDHNSSGDVPAIRFVDLATGAENLTIPADTRIAPAVVLDGSRLAWLDQTMNAIVVWNADHPDSPVSVPLPDSGRLLPVPYGALYFLPGAQQVLLTGFQGTDSGENELWIVDLP